MLDLATVGAVFAGRQHMVNRQSSFKIMVLIIGFCLSLTVHSEEIKVLYAAASEDASDASPYWIGAYKVNNEYILELLGPFPTEYAASLGPTAEPFLVWSSYIDNLNEALSRIPDNSDIKVIISSRGGALKIAKVASKNIRDKCRSNGASTCQITVYIPSFGRCDSACIPFFQLAGDFRAAAGNAEFGFHAGNSWGLVTGQTAADVYQEGAIHADWLAKILGNGMLDRAEITDFSAEEMKSSGLVHSIQSLAAADILLKYYGNGFWVGNRQDFLSEQLAGLSPNITYETTVGILRGTQNLRGNYVVSGVSSAGKSFAYELCIGAYKDGLLHHPRRSELERREFIKRVDSYVNKKIKATYSLKTRSMHYPCVGDIVLAESP